MEDNKFLSEIESGYIETQKNICLKYGAQYLPSFFSQIAGVAIESLEKKVLPINGLRHSIENNNSSSWFIWAGEYSNAPEFFKPVHIHHLLELYPNAIKFLGLSPGWRFLTDGVYEDVWFDEKLLEV